MYTSLKKLISKHFYATLAEAQKKVDVFYASNRLTDEQFVELASLLEEVYGAEQ